MGSPGVAWTLKVPIFCVMMVISSNKFTVGMLTGSLFSTLKLFLTVSL